MKVEPRRIAIWGGLFVLAFVGGSWLGKFVVAGVDRSGAPMSESAMAQAAPPGFAHNGAANAAVAPHAARPLQVYNPSEHVCEGCDAGATRDRQLAQQMGLPVDDTPGDGDSAESEDAGEQAAAR